MAIEDDWRFRAGFTAGYRQGKEAGLSETSAAGELATLRERLSRAENHSCADFLPSTLTIHRQDVE